MQREEFLEILREQLSGQMQEGKVAAHIRYYEDYIQSQISSGRSEGEVLNELGDPRLIAKTLVDTDPDAFSGEEIYHSDYGYSSDSDQETSGEFHTVKRFHRLDLTTWYGKLIVIVAAVAIVALLLAVIGAVLPFFIILAIILFVISRFKKR